MTAFWNEAGATLPLLSCRISGKHCGLSRRRWDFGLLLWYGYHLRVTRMRAIERLRVQIAADLHDDVGVAVDQGRHGHGIGGTADARGRPEQAHIRKSRRTTREVIQAMDEIVWTINPKNDTLDNLANYIFQYAQEYFQNTSCPLPPGSARAVPGSAAFHRGAAQFVHGRQRGAEQCAQARRSNRSAHRPVRRRRKVVISVIDNGCGFSLNGSMSSGNGLGNMRNRSQTDRRSLDASKAPRGRERRVEMEAHGEMTGNDRSPRITNVQKR